MSYTHYQPISVLFPNKFNRKLMDKFCWSKLGGGGGTALLVLLDLLAAFDTIDQRDFSDLLAEMVIRVPLLIVHYQLVLESSTLEQSLKPIVLVLQDPTELHSIPYAT